MRISFERTGGFAGTRLTTIVDTATLPIEEANHLHQLVKAADFFHLPTTITSPTSQPDRFQYKLVVEAKSRQHTVNVSEQAVPDALKLLIEWLLEAARRR